MRSLVPSFDAPVPSWMCIQLRPRMPPLNFMTLPRTVAGLPARAFRFAHTVAIVVPPAGGVIGAVTSVTGALGAAPIGAWPETIAGIAPAAGAASPSRQIRELK
ncbi:MAG: hypothetical protein NTY02_07825 [Acidobacteria bacterium]|nr:hypothetical protein [Acidobacteriota bacterium]